MIPKEQAIFWLDKNGFWHTEQGKFENRKIMSHFHSCIRLDEGGYYLQQDHRHFREKVYFRHEDTPLFVFYVLREDDIILLLNTGKRVTLKPKRLFIREESLYMHMGKERVKFTEGALITIANDMEDEKGAFFIRVKGRRYRIAHEN